MAAVRIVLFDIDGTLTLSGGAGARALTRAFREVFGIVDALEGVRLHGQTDPQIVQDALGQAGVPLSESADRLDLLRSRYVTYLGDEMPRSANARVLPGVVQLLERLSAAPRFVLGLLTGNIESGARIKLEPFDLNRFFAFGAFGCDSPVRRDLVPIAVERARARNGGGAVSMADVVVVGDTDRDVDCGRHWGARTLAVATGGATRAELVAAGADHVFEDFTQTDRVVEALATL
jgi:phosphoglycolate phosphatase-like HAD superfamily hydrolase